jgi:outer membrane receptor protein involved in Fe transport
MAGEPLQLREAPKMNACALRRLALSLALSATAFLAAPAFAQPPTGEPLLPRVDVRPPTDTSDADDAFDFPDNPFDVPLSYPSLTDQIFGQNDGFGQTTGILRNGRSLYDVPFAGSITSRQQITEKQAPDMFHALQNEVGILMQSTAAGQASPFVRGLTGQQVLILVDGIRLNNSTFRYGPNQYFNTIDPGMVDHIEVLRGQGSVLWGSDAIGGAINVVTRGPDVDWGRNDGNYSGGEFVQYFNTANISPYSRMNVEGWHDSFGLFAGGSFLNVRDLDTGWDHFSRQPGTNYQQYAGDIKMNYLIDDGQMLTVALQHHELEDVPRSDRFPGYPGDVNNSNTAAGARFFDPQQRDLAYIRYQALELGPWIDALTFTASYHRQRDVQTRSDRLQETDVDTTGINLVLAKDCDWAGKIITGVDWYYDDVDSRFERVGGAIGPIIPDDAYYSRIGWFANWDVAITQNLDAIAGVRYERIDLAATPVVGGTPVSIAPKYEDWIGQVGLVYKLTPQVNLVGSISEGFRAPNLDELTANNPNVLQQGTDLPSLGLLPEQSINYEVGVKTNSDRLRSQLFFYWMDLDQNIVRLSVGADQFERENQDSMIQGCELSGDYLLTDSWSLYGNFWYTYGQNLETNAPLSRIPPTQGILGLRWRNPEVRSYFDLYTWLVDSQRRLDPVSDIGDERIPAGGTPGYGTLNMRAGRAFGACGRHRLSLSLENITDQPYLVHGSGVYGTGVTARFGYSWVY